MSMERRGPGRGRDRGCQPRGNQDNCSAPSGIRVWLGSAVRVLVLAGLIGPCLLLGHPPAEAGKNDHLWTLLKGAGQVVLIRHASTVPGTGDPPGFRVEVCATQRNLSEAGREEARRLGAAFREREVPVGTVLSSRWCRCLDTARLAFGRVEPWPALDSFFDDRSREAEQTRAVRERAGQPLTRGNLILVTHQVNITALTGIVPSQGEMVILTPRDGGFTVAGRFNPAGTR